MFSQINGDLAIFLRHLNSTYHSHGINFDVTQFHQILFKLLTPYDLLTYFKIKNPAQILDQRFSNMFASNDQYNKSTHLIFNQQKFNQKKNRLERQYLQQRPQRKKKNNQVNQNNSSQQQNKVRQDEQQESQNRTRKDSSRRQQKMGQKIVARQQNDQLYYQLDRSQRISHGAKPILNFEDELKVQKFVIQSVAKGRTLSMQDIATYAKKISMQNKNVGYFLASIGWVRNFMRRYPKMRQLYVKSREANKGFFDELDAQQVPYFRPQQNLFSQQNSECTTNRNAQNVKRQLQPENSNIDYDSANNQHQFLSANPNQNQRQKGIYKQQFEYLCEQVQKEKKGKQNSFLDLDMKTLNKRHK